MRPKQVISGETELIKLIFLMKKEIFKEHVAASLYGTPEIVTFYKSIASHTGRDVLFMIENHGFTVRI